MIKKLFCAILVTPLFAGCATNSVTNRQQLMLVPEDQVIASSYNSYSNIINQAKGNSSLNVDPIQTNRAKEIASRIIPHAVSYRSSIINWQWDVNVLESNEINAFCMAGGKIAVYSGLIRTLNPTDDELAQVIAHEIAHALSEHTREKISVAMASNLVVGVAAAKNGLSQTQVDLLNNLTSLAIKLPNSRQAEGEADSIGILLAARAGYDPYAAATLWEKMSHLGNSTGLSILSTHPLPIDRITAMRSEAAQLNPIYQKTSVLRSADKLPKIEYENGQAKNLYGKARYEMPSSKQ